MQSIMYTKNELIELLKEQDESVVEDLLRRADDTRRVYLGDEVHLRGLIEFSNYCRRDCIYCGLRKSNRNLHRYRMDISEILTTAAEAKALGFKTLVIQSGEDPAYSVGDLCALVQEIKSDLGVAVTLCVGEKSYDDYKQMKEAGVDRYLLRFETSDPNLFKTLKPDGDYTGRMTCLEWLHDLGYQVGSGNMVGLPGQTVESLADDILLFARLDLDMIGLGPFISHPDTPLAGSPDGTLDQVLRVTALTRLLTKNVHMPATTATGTIDTYGRQRALQCGANVLMPNMTPTKYRKHYALYPDKICIGDDARKCRFCVQAMLEGLGRSISQDAGHSLKKAS
jgi:biotin synthase